MSNEISQMETRRRPGGRSARVRDAVIAATVAELETHGYDKLKIGAVAARAGVHESSIYRRWKTREGLAMEATFALFASHIRLPDKGSLIEDLVALLCNAGRYLEGPLAHAAMQFGLAMRDDPEVITQMHALWSQRFEVFRTVFARAKARGEWSGANEGHLLEALLGVVYLRVFLLRQPVTPRQVRPIVATLLSARAQ